MMRHLLAAGAASLALAGSAGAQSMSGMNMPGMTMPSTKAPSAPKKAVPLEGARARTKARRGARPRNAHGAVKHAASAPVAAHAMAGMNPNAMKVSDGQSMPGMAMPSSGGPATAGAIPMHDMGHGQMQGSMGGMTMAAAPSGTDLPAGSAPPPVPPVNHYADRTYGHDAMEHGRSVMMRDEGGQLYHQVMFNLAEFQAHEGRNGYRWDGEAWLGGDRDRLVVKSEGEGTFHEGVDSAELQALYSRAVGPYFNLQAGIRHDFQPKPSRTYATLGFEGLAPFQFETEGVVFLSEKGDVLGRLEGWYDERLTQHLVLQPRVELNLSAQNVPEDRYGSGVVDAELGLRLRYEIRREFAPYVGVSWQRKAGRTADYARADGKDTGGPSFVAGIRFWF